MEYSQGVIGMRTFAVFCVVLLLSVCETVSVAEAKTEKKTKPLVFQKSTGSTTKKSQQAAPKSLPSAPNPGSPGQSKTIPAPPSNTAPAKVQQPGSDSPSDVYSSLVIDAAGFKLERSMCPKILRADGSEVWGTLRNLKDEDYDFLQEHGMVAYVSGLQEAYANERCGGKPLVIKAVRTDGKGFSGVVVSDEDAARILEENRKAGFLDKFKVIFIKNESPSAAVGASDTNAQQEPFPASSQ
ncbi:MAG: hypothetical protein QHI38_02425 [Armatimonadota bacterium]|nr:hypothetical protein [Armatimonadota bacterium]